MNKSRHVHEESEMPEPETERNDVQVDALQSELDEAKRKAEEYLSLLQRVQADFTNFRRRVDQERSEQSLSVRANVILKFLPVLDDFERALQAVPPEGKKLDWAQGIALIQRKLLSILEAEGVSRIEALGKEFDPWEMEAVLHQESDEHEDGEVTSVFRDGYKLNDKVIRPAQVGVAKSTEQ